MKYHQTTILITFMLIIQISLSATGTYSITKKELGNNNYGVNIGKISLI